MFDRTSRYYAISTAIFTDASGREIVYVRRRFLPSSSPNLIIAEHVVTQGDRLDNVTALHLGDPLQFWRVADANGAMKPADLTREPGRRLRIPFPQEG
jgi:hypothetical protein